MPHKPKNITLVKLANSQVNDSDQKIEDIIAALDFLRSEAKKSNNEDIYRLIDSTFTICLNTYCMIKRYEMNNYLNKKH